MTKCQFTSVQTNEKLNKFTIQTNDVLQKCICHKHYHVCYYVYHECWSSIKYNDKLVQENTLVS